MSKRQLNKDITFPKQKKIKPYSALLEKITIIANENGKGEIDKIIDLLYCGSTNPNIKVEYLYILSKRSIANQNHYIPKNYVSSQHWNNTFVKERTDKLELILE